MQITWYGTASLVIEADGCKIALDPYVTRNRRLLRIRPDDLDRVDALLLTHGHFDHSADIPFLLNGAQTPVYASSETASRLSALTPFRTVNFKKITPSEALNIQKIRIKPYPAAHVRFDPILIARTIPRILGWMFSRPGCFLRIVADVKTYSMGQVFAWEIAFQQEHLLVFGSMGLLPDVDYPSGGTLVLPLQGNSRIDHLALEAVKRIQPGTVIVFHHDDSFPPVSSEINPTNFRTLMKRSLPGVKLIVPSPGEMFTV